MMRRVGAPPDRDTDYHHRPGAYALLPIGDGLLLTCDASGRPEIQLPGGGIEPGEPPMVALHREVLEETGWRIARPRKLWSYRRFVWMPEYRRHAEKICHVYVATPVRRLHPPMEPGHTAVVLPLARAARLLASPGDRLAVASFLL